MTLKEAKAQMAQIGISPSKQDGEYRPERFFANGRCL